MTHKTFKRKLLIDLDGVLNEYTGNYEENVIPPIKRGAKEFLEKCFEENYEIKIFTTRNRLRTTTWLIDNGLDKVISDVTNVKEPAYLYIDDRCILFNGDFNKTLQQIDSFKVHWK